MTVVNPQSRSFSFRPVAVGFAVAFALVGCKSGSSDSGTRTNDPLVNGNRIPPQNVPLLDRGAIGTNGKSDPLLGSPTSKPQDRSGVGYSDDPSRFRGTYIPGPGSAPAALAVNLKDGDALKIDGNENRTPLQQTGATLPPKSFEQDQGLDALYAEFKKYGCESGDRSLGRGEGGDYIFRASVLRQGGTGARLQVTGVGKTPDEAVKQALDQVVSDRQ